MQRDEHIVNHVIVVCDDSAFCFFIVYLRCLLHGTCEIYIPISVVIELLYPLIRLTSVT